MAITIRRTDREKAVTTVLGRLAFGYAINSDLDPTRAAAFLTAFQNTYNSYSSELRSLVSNNSSLSGVKKSPPSRLTRIGTFDTDTATAMYDAMFFTLYFYGKDAVVLLASFPTTASSVGTWLLNNIFSIDDESLYTVLFEYDALTKSTSNSALLGTLTTRATQEISLYPTEASVATSTSSSSGSTSASTGTRTGEEIVVTGETYKGMSPWVVAGIAGGVAVAAGVLIINLRKG